MASRNRLSLLYADLATLLDAGVPILRSLDIMIQGRQGSLQQVLTQIRESLSKGSSLAESMDRHRGVFPEMDRMLVEAAETAGSLSDSFKMLSHWHEFISRITRRIWMGLMYPFLILHMGAFVAPLPYLVMGFVQGNASVGGYLIRVLQVLLLLYVPMLVILAAMRSEKNLLPLRAAIDHLVLRIPLLGRAVYHLSVCRYTRAFGMLYKAGVPITECTQKATRATGNVVVARLFAGAATSVRGGGTAGAGLSKRLPAEYRDLWMIGEETGELDKTIDKISEIAADRADLYFTHFGDWMPKIVYFIILGIMAYMILTLARQVYGNLYRF